MGVIFIIENSIQELERIKTLLKGKDYKFVYALYSDTNIFQKIKNSFATVITIEICLKSYDDVKEFAGVALAEDIRQNFLTPIIFISSKNNEVVINKIINISNSTLLIKPLYQVELIYQIEKILNQNPIIKLDEEFEFNTKTKDLIKNGKKIKLTNQEKKLLDFFINDKNRILPKQEIERYLWKEEISNITLIALISKLKRKLNKKFIINHYKEGYEFRIKN